MEPQPDMGPEKTDGIRFGPLGERWMHVCVDMQRMFAEPTDWQTPWLPRVLPSVVRLVEPNPARTVFTRFVPVADPEDMPGAWQRYYRRWAGMTLGALDETMVELVPELAHHQPPAACVDKHTYSPWTTPVLARLLADRGVDTLVISGAETEVCVLATVLGAIDRGYRVVLATDAVCSSADATHDAMLEIYHSRFGMQVETAQIDEILEAVA